VAGVVVAVIGLSVFGVVWAVKTGDPRWIFVSLPFTLMIFVLARYAPTGYRLGPDGIRVERRGGPAVIDYRRIRAVDRESRAVVGMSMFGSQGLFGRFGTFWNMRLGFYRLYLTNRDTIVWLATDAGWIGVSPDRPDEFVARLESRLTR
jgi:hypothetical protein